jgi:hypothetical protein
LNHIPRLDKVDPILRLPELFNSNGLELGSPNFFSLRATLTPPLSPKGQDKKCFTHFNTCQTFGQQTETPFPVDFAIEALGALKMNFESRFSDFDAIANDIILDEMMFTFGFNKTFQILCICMDLRNKSNQPIN